MISNFASSAQKYESAYPIKEDELPASKRGYHTNNQYDNVPPLMNDGRSLISTNQSDSAENKKLIEENNIQSNWEYRRYLTKNAPKVIESNYMSYTDNGFINTTMDVPSIQSNVVNPNGLSVRAVSVCRPHKIEASTKIGNKNPF